MSYTPEYPPSAPQSQPSKHGCFFYGCITSLVLMVVVAIGLFFFAKAMLNKVAAFTQPAPMTLPSANATPAEIADVGNRADKFFDSLGKNVQQAALVLSERELNALIAAKAPQLKDKIYVSIEGNTLKGQISYPLDQLALGTFKGRYLNGTAVIKVSLENGGLIVTMQSLKVGDKEVPEEAMKGLRDVNLAKDVYKDAKSVEQIRKLETISVKDGTLIVVGRPVAK